MRYTTVIDITELPRIARNKNAWLIYLYMALKCGYHADDKDILKSSIRVLASRTGISVSATRHALKLLEAEQILSRVEGGWNVKKWLIESYPDPKAYKKRSEAQMEKAKRDDEERKKWLQALQKAVTTSTREELADWLENLKSSKPGTRVYHKGVQLWNCEEHIEWLSKMIARL